MKENVLVLHSTNIGAANVRTLVSAAKTGGFSAVEPNILQINDFLSAGYSESELKDVFDGIDVPAMGWLEDCERQGSDYKTMMKEAEEVFSIAETIGSCAVQITNGPVDVNAVKAFANKKPYHGYKGLLGMDIDKQKRLTVRNLRALADLASQASLLLYIEPLAWTQLNTIRQGTELCTLAGRDNVKLVIDFWHGFIAGDTPDYISKLDADIIYGVHVCDSLPFNGGIPVECELRNVELGKGIIPINEWVEAVKATGYKKWWSYESFSLKEAQTEPHDLSKRIYQKLNETVTDA